VPVHPPTRASAGRSGNFLAVLLTQSPSLAGAGPGERVAHAHRKLLTTDRKQLDWGEMLMQ